MTKADLKALDSKALVALYNRLTKKHIKKFSSRAAGEKQVLKLLPASTTVKTVNGTASAGTVGRPKTAFAVELIESQAKSNPQKTSNRTAML